MIQIRDLTQKDLKQAIALKVLCWPEETRGKTGALNFDQELSFWTDWMNSAAQNQDIRRLLGAFEGNELLGAAFASLAEKSDILSDGIELNGLWVHPCQRGRGLSLMLVTRILDDFAFLGMRQIVIYCFHDSPANAYYRHFGCRVIRQEKQTEANLIVDVFQCLIDTLKTSMNNALSAILRAQSD